MNRYKRIPIKVSVCCLLRATMPTIESTLEHNKTLFRADRNTNFVEIKNLSLGEHIPDAGVQDMRRTDSAKGTRREAGSLSVWLAVVALGAFAVLHPRVLCCEFYFKRRFHSDWPELGGRGGRKGLSSCLRMVAQTNSVTSFHSQNPFSHLIFVVCSRDAILMCKALIMKYKYSRAKPHPNRGRRGFINTLRLYPRLADLYALALYTVFRNSRLIFKGVKEEVMVDFC